MGTAPSRFVTNIPDDLICPDCMGVYDRPEMGSCGHILCAGCWICNERYKIIDFNIMSKIFCPVCQEYIALKAFKRVPLKELEETISKMFVRCTHANCKSVLRLSDFEKHIDDAHSSCIRRTCDSTLKSYFEYK